VQRGGAGAVGDYFGERVVAWELADAAAQATATMQRYECACWLLQKFFVGKIQQGGFVSGTGSTISTSCDS